MGGTTSFVLFAVALSLTVGVTLCLDSVQEVDIRQCSRRGECDNQHLNQYTLHIGLMLSFPDPLQRESLASKSFDDGHDIAPAAYLAVEQINNRSDILQDYKLEISRFDGGCEVSTRTTVGINNLYCSCERIVGIIGPSCELSTQIVSNLTNREEFSMITINYGGQNESVGNYPYSFGLLGKNDIYARVIADLLIANNWTNTALMYFGIEEFYIKENRALVDRLNLTDYKFQFSSAIYDSFIPLDEVKRSFSRVIVLLTNRIRRLQILCMAYHEQMTFPNYLWIFDEIISPIENVTFTYTGTEYVCSEVEIIDALHGSIYPALNAFQMGPNSELPTSSGFSAIEYSRRYQLQTKVYSEQFGVPSHAVDWANVVYDAVWVLAFALNDTLQNLNTSLTNFRLGSKDLAETLRNSIMSRKNLLGTIGNITLILTIRDLTLIYPSLYFSTTETNQKRSQDILTDS